MPHEQKRNVSVLFGNGFNQLYGGKKWIDLIKDVAGDLLINEIPYPMMYEAAYLQGAGLRVQRLGNDNEVISLKKALGEQVQQYETNDVYNKLLDLPVDSFLTTNFDLAFQQTLESNGYQLVDSSHIETLYSIRRKEIYSLDGVQEKVFWPLHGIVTHPKSMMWGFNHYCGALTKVDEYIKGNYSTKQTSQYVKSMLTRFREGECPSFVEFKSWIDAFFFSDLHIVGFGLSTDEIDLWHVLNLRKRYMYNAESQVNIQNRIIYYGDFSGKDDFRRLLESFGVEVVDIPIDGDNYKEQYVKIFEKINNQ